MGLEKLDQHSAKATFFALEKYRSIPIYFEKLIEKKHSVGNHTFDHLNGWKTTNSDYNANISLCENSIENHTSGISSLDSRIFRSMAHENAQRH
jgi:peptidoglycan/xylan/chitin deacetylase (PgdA/CDA1 family)